MVYLHDFIQFILHLNIHLKTWVELYGIWVYLLLFAIVFCETGLVVTPFLPGDSLLFAAGTVFASTHLNINWLALILILAAFCGDNCNYFIAWRFGRRLFKTESRWFKPIYLERTSLFYERYGPSAIIIARFAPILRTFMPFVAGLAAMPYPRFISFSLLGAVLWIGILLYSSYWFGSIPIVKEHFSLIIIGIIIISLLPAAITFIKHLRSERRGV